MFAETSDDRPPPPRDRPIVITDPRVSGRPSEGIRFAKDCTFRPSEHAVVMLHSLWRSFPRTAEQATFLVELVARAFAAQILMLSVRRMGFESFPRTLATGSNWEVLSRTASQINLKIPAQTIEHLASFLDSTGRRNACLVEFVVDAGDSCILSAQADFAYELLVAAAKARHPIIQFDFDDDALECTLPISHAADVVVTELINRGLARPR